MARSDKNEMAAAIRSRTDGRKALLVYMDSRLIKAVKKAALDDDKNVYELVEDAVRLALKERETKGQEGR